EGLVQLIARAGLGDAQELVEAAYLDCFLGHRPPRDSRPRRAPGHRRGRSGLPGDGPREAPRTGWLDPRRSATSARIPPTRARIPTWRLPSGPSTARARVASIVAIRKSRSGVRMSPNFVASIWSAYNP